MKIEEFKQQERSKDDLHNIDSKALIALLIGVCAIGFAPIFVRLAADIHPSSIAFWRNFLSTPLLALIWIFLPGGFRLVDKPKISHYCCLVAASLAFSLDLIVWHKSILMTSVANAAFLVNFAPIFVAILSILFLREKISLATLVGLIIAFAGAGCLIYPNLSNVNTKSELHGDLLALGAASFYAMYIVLVQRARVAFSATTIMLSTSLLCSVFVYVFVILSGYHVNVDGVNSAQTWQALFYLAFISNVIGQGLIAYSLAHIPAVIASIIMLLQPVVSIIVAWFLFGETIVSLQYIGIFITIVGIVLAKLGNKKAVKI